MILFGEGISLGLVAEPASPAKAGPARPAEAGAGCLSGPAGLGSIVQHNLYPHPYLKIARNKIFILDPTVLQLIFLLV